MVDRYLIEDIEVEDTLKLLIGARGTIEEIKQKMAERFFKNLKTLQTLKILELVEDKDMEIVLDNALIGSILVIDKGGREVQYDIQLFYIKDNLDNYYITETQVLEVVL